ncbi:sensor histidine kinase [Clostridium butyricum]
MDFANCEIIRVIEDITLSIAQSEKSQKNIIFDTNTEFLEIKCDPENIERVMLNLLSNAIKFTDNDGEIIVSCEENEDYLVIRVKDNGIGIPPEFRSRIFERFVQVDKSFRRNVEGSGIGLSIVKFIVDSHEGEIYINDEVIKGCEFVIKIPNVKIENDIVVNNYNKELKKEINAKVNIELSDIQ